MNERYIFYGNANTNLYLHKTLLNISECSINSIHVKFVNFTIYQIFTISTQDIPNIQRIFSHTKANNVVC